MSNDSHALSTSQLVSHVRERCGLDADREQRIRAWLARNPDDEGLPFYLNIVLFIGAFIASSFLIGSLTAAGLIPVNAAAGRLIWGLLLCGIALGIEHLWNDGTPSAWNTFGSQVSLCLLFAGKALLVWWYLDVSGAKSGWAVTHAALALTIATYRIYGASADRYISVLVTLGSVLVNLYIDAFEARATSGWVMHFFYVQAASVLVLFAVPWIHRRYIPLAYAVASSLTGMVLIAACAEILAGNGMPVLMHRTGMSVALALMLFGTVTLVQRESGGLSFEIPALAAVTCTLLVFAGAPGLLLSLLFMVLGYARHEPPLQILGIVTLPAFLTLYYYNLDISLLDKSLVLIGSGLVLLAVRLFLGFRGYDKELPQ